MQRRLNTALERMPDDSTTLWLHAYAGPENGLMVIGTPKSLRSLAEDILARVDSGVVDAQPRRIATAKSVGPYTDIPNYTVSFCLQGTAPLEQVAPWHRRDFHPAVFVLIGVLALVGLFSAARWVWAYAL